jgi:uncharacterized protein
MQFNYPFKIDGTGRTARTDDITHVRQLIEQVLFTTIEERVNRPTFGTRINQLVFAPNSEELAATTRILVQSSLQQWLGDLIKVVAVETKIDDSTLHILVEYLLVSANNNQSNVDRFTRRL